MTIKSNAWIDVFQPQTINECFLPKSTKEHIKRIIDSGDVPSMFFSGPPGIGKTTTALVICKMLDLDYMMINASLYGNIDTVRTDIQQFASTISFNGKKKVIILDEADGLTAAAQTSLRAAINEYTNNCAFILTANFRNKIIEPLISRFDEVEFLFGKDELPELAVGLYKFITSRLEEENVQSEPKAVQEFIKRRITKSSDIRKLLIDAQKIAKTGVFDFSSSFDVDASRLQDLVPMIKTQNFDKIRKWVGENSDISFESIVSFLYNNLKIIVDDYQIPVIINILNEGQYKHAFVIDKEINLANMIMELSVTIK